MEQKKDVLLNVTKLKKGQVIETKSGKTFTVGQDETSIYINQDLTLKKGDKLFLNSIPEEDRKYNQTHYIKIARAK